MTMKSNLLGIDLNGGDFFPIIDISDRCQCVLLALVRHWSSADSKVRQRQPEHCIDMISGQRLENQAAGCYQHLPTIGVLLESVIETS